MKNGFEAPEVRCIQIGKSHSSEDVAAEYSEAVARWARDVAFLAPYGHGKTVLEGFVALGAQHAALRASRPGVVAEKRIAVSSRDGVVADGWKWVDRVGSGLMVLARDDHELAVTLSEALPDTDAELEGGIGAMAEALESLRDRMPEDASVAERLAEASVLRERLGSARGDAENAKAKRVADTAAIDLLDGRICIAIRDLNHAARCAIRHGDLSASLSEYRFHHLKRTRSAVAEPEAEETATQPPAPMTAQ